MIEGFRHLPGLLDPAAQRVLLADVLAAVGGTAWFSPAMPGSGRPLSVRMANLGPLGWVSDRAGYRYQPAHPETGAPWPPIPPRVLELWREITAWPAVPECCLVNLYRGEARLGLHQDRDEIDLAAPVLSISLGDEALFRLGGMTRNAPTCTMVLHSGDVVVLGGAARLAFHGVDRVLAGTSDLVPGGGRINLTLRRVSPV
jgi:alkylated DNA repair protein (DNA oxidative demethylase)